MLAAEGKP